jgi:hypothetical protein
LSGNVHFGLIWFTLRGDFMYGPKQNLTRKFFLGRILMERSMGRGYYMRVPM